MQKLKLIIFTDGRPGHEKQSRGIVQALENYVSLEISEIDVLHNSVISDGLSYINYFLGRATSLCVADDTDLVIGTGSRTHIPLLSCKRKCRARAVVSMTPNLPLRKHFDLCLVPFHDQVEPASNIFETIGPPGVASHESKHDSKKGLILIGGIDHRSHYWNQAEIIEYINELISLSRETSWIISSSPRTPEKTEEKLEEFAAGKDHVDFYSFSTTPNGWIERQYNENKIVWITGDSISMVYEALSAGCRVGILPVKWKTKKSKFQFSERYLVDQKRVITYSDWHKKTVDWSESEDQPLNEADRCAREILGRWWPKNLR
jgi:mitochondrial fission protein ELM1